MKENKKNKVPQKIHLLNEPITIQSKNALKKIYIFNEPIMPPKYTHI